MRRVAVSWYVVGYLVIVAAFVYGLWLIQHQADVENYLRCLEGNKARAAIVDGFDAYTDALIAASTAGDVEDPPEDPVRRQQQIELFRREVAQRLAPLKPTDCGQRP